MNITAGGLIPGVTFRVEAQAMKPVALLLRDPNPIHLDPDVVHALGLGDRVINQGPVNAAYVWEMLDRWLDDTARIRTLDLRYTSNAFGGEDITAGGRVEDIDHESGVARCAVYVRHADGTDVVRGHAVVALKD